MPQPARTRKGQLALCGHTVIREALHTPYCTTDPVTINELIIINTVATSGPNPLERPCPADRTLGSLPSTTRLRGFLHGPRSLTLPLLEFVLLRPQCYSNCRRHLHAAMSYSYVHTQGTPDSMVRPTNALSARRSPKPLRICVNFILATECSKSLYFAYTKHTQC